MENKVVKYSEVFSEKSSSLIGQISARKGLELPNLIMLPLVSALAYIKMVTNIDMTQVRVPVTSILKVTDIVRGWRIKQWNEVTRDDGSTHGYYHMGLDVNANVGTDVFSPGSGKVIFAGWETGVGGKAVWIGFANAKKSISFNHLSEILVKVGDEVQQGDLVAKSGNTRTKTTTVGAHLHISVRNYDASESDEHNVYKQKELPADDLVLVPDECYDKKNYGTWDKQKGLFNEG